jgi:hypothetical protein
LCIDYNECLDSKGTASSNICENNFTCINTIGSYICSCSVGFQQTTLNNQTICVDINKCSLNSPLYSCPYPYSCQMNQGDYDCCNNNDCKSCGQQYVTPVARIIGGSTTNSNSWPWMVSIGGFFVLLK